MNLTLRKTGLRFAGYALMMLGLVRAAAAQAPTEPESIPMRRGFDFSVWERVAIQDEGIEKSLLTYARDTVRELTGNANFGDRDPIENVFSMALEPRLWADQPILKVRHPELKTIFPEKFGRISPITFEQRRDKWVPLVGKPGNPDDKSGTAKDKKGVETELMHLVQKTDGVLGMSEKLRFVPAEDVQGNAIEWRTVDELGSRIKEKSPAQEKLLTSWGQANMAFVANDPIKFNTASREVASALSELRLATSSPQWKINLDRFEARVGLFRIAGWVYLAAALIFGLSYLTAPRFLSVAGGAALVAGVLTHIAAMVVRGILAGRTPVANLFESAVFIICAMTVLSVIIGAYYRTRIVGVAGAVLGAFFMGIANTIPLQYGRKVLPLVDALQSYWLRIHVTSMLISYAFFAISLFISLAYVVRRIRLVRKGGADIAADTTLLYLDSLNFRIITIGFPVLTAGVILGAVWASEAWGRPWGFDPKETAAAITWMIYALYLHCRLFLGWRGMRGMGLSLVGAAAVIFTYLGVSFFLPGLHSYVSEGISFTDFLKKLIPG